MRALLILGALLLAGCGEYKSARQFARDGAASPSPAPESVAYEQTSLDDALSSAGKIHR